MLQSLKDGDMPYHCPFLLQQFTYKLDTLELHLLQQIFVKRRKKPYLFVKTWYVQLFLAAHWAGHV